MRGLRARVVSDNGAHHVYPLTGALEPLGTASILPGPYRTEVYAYEAIAVQTHKPPLGAYRGVGMTMGAFVMERLLDLLAERVGVDPARDPPAQPHPARRLSLRLGQRDDLRQRRLPHARSSTRSIWPATTALRREQAAARAEGRLVGIGVACYTEYTGMGSDVFRRRGMEDVPGVEARHRRRWIPTAACAARRAFPRRGRGTRRPSRRSSPTGSASRSRACASCRPTPPSAPAGSGTFGSRGAVSIGGAVGAAADRVRARLRALAGHRLEAAAGRHRARGGARARPRLSRRGVAVAELARLAYSPPRGGLPPELGPGLSATVYFDPPGPTFSGAVHVAVVEVDRETGRPRVRRYVVVEDCGPVVNPMIVEGQIHGAVAQGLGEALLESLVYDDDGQLLTATLMDYALPGPTTFPRSRSAIWRRRRRSCRGA